MLRSLLKVHLIASTRTSHLILTYAPVSIELVYKGPEHFDFRITVLPQILVTLEFMKEILLKVREESFEAGASLFVCF